MSQKPIIESKAFRKIDLCRHVNAILLIGTAIFFFLFPALTVSHELLDPNLRSPGVPASAWSLHRELSPGFARWADERMKLQRAKQLSINDISGTEWPLFGAVFYLWSTESLQDEWAKGHSPARVAPNVYARDAIDAAARLVVDPAQASWVKVHWGDRYLKTENVFYRMLVISALTSHAQLTGDKEYLPMLKEQVDSLSAELDASPRGLLDDYPNQCFPGDVLTATAMIHRADKVLGTDHSAFVSRELRAFHGDALDLRGLVRYAAWSRQADPLDLSRGCANSYVSLFAPEIWPDDARNWYDRYTKYFWQTKAGCAGFREFPNDLPGNNWYVDVDSGLVLNGYGCAACAFGVGAARVNGHFEQAYPLTTEMLVTSWPLPHGTRLLPRVLSNAADAPYLGEAAILFNLTRLPAEGVTVTKGGSIPWIVWIWLAGQFFIGTGVLLVSIRSLRRWRWRRDSIVVPGPQIQFAIWLSLLLPGVVLLFLGKPLPAILLMLFAQLLPRYRHLAIERSVAETNPS